MCSILGPELVTECPQDFNASCEWFSKLWNSSLGRHLAEAVCYHSEDSAIMDTWNVSFHLIFFRLYLK